MKRDSIIREAPGFSDVLLLPSENNVRAQDVSLKTRFTRNIALHIPLVSAGRENVTESVMAIAMARLGGIGIIHDRMPLGKQVEEVRKVKRAEAALVKDPITISPEANVAEAIDLMATYKISGLPVVEAGTQRVVGIITARDVRFATDYSKTVADLMTRDVVTVSAAPEAEEAKRLFHEHRIEKLVLTDAQGRCAGLVTVRDLDRLAARPHATRDAHGRLCVAAAVSLGKDAFDRAAAMADAGLDAVVIDVANAHSREAIGTVSRIRQQRTTEVQVVAGNVSTAAGARSLIDAGADAIKVGVSKGFDGTGHGLPLLAAIIDVAQECALADVPLIVDGGIFDPATFAKALAAGGSAAAISCLFAGTEEAPGAIVFREGRAFKSPDTPYRGAVQHAADYLLDGLRAAMACGNGKDIASFCDSAVFVRAGKD